MQYEQKTILINKLNCFFNGLQKLIDEINLNELHVIIRKEPHITQTKVYFSKTLWISYEIITSKENPRAYFGDSYIKNFVFNKDSSFDIFSDKGLDDLPNFSNLEDDEVMTIKKNMSFEQFLQNGFSNFLRFYKINDTYNEVTNQLKNNNINQVEKKIKI